MTMLTLVIGLAAVVRPCRGGPLFAVKPCSWPGRARRRRSRWSAVRSGGSRAFSSPLYPALLGLVWGRKPCPFQAGCRRVRFPSPALAIVKLTTFGLLKTVMGRRSHPKA